MTQGIHSTARPTIATGGRLTRPVQDRGNRFVWHMASKDLHELNNVHTGFPAFLTKFILPDTQTRVIATMPIYDKLYLVGYDVDYNLFD
jgi:hypothetical protein